MKDAKTATESSAKLERKGLHKIKAVTESVCPTDNRSGGGIGQPLFYRINYCLNAVVPCCL